MFADGFNLQPPYLTVGQITAHLRSVLLQDDILQDIWVRGEASSVTLSRGGHLFFSLKDSDALIKAVAWAPLSHRLHAKLRDGQEVLAHGRVDLYAPQGVYQLYVSEVLPVGTGVAYLEFERVRSLLAEEGLFDEERKRPLPRYPTRIGVVTSAYGAARRDIENVLAQRWPTVEVVFAGAQVQGDGAAVSLIAGLRKVAEAGVDVVILGRGGGDMEALSCFNDEELARAIVAMPVPVVTGIGHETDFTIADFVADLRAPTPSAAAMAVVPDREDVAASIGALQQRLARAADDLVGDRWTDVRQLTRLFQRSSPQYVIGTGLQTLDEATTRLLQSGGRLTTNRRASALAAATRIRAQAPRLDRQRERVAWASAGLARATAGLLSDARSGLSQASIRLESLDPAETLRRGYSVVHSGDLSGPVVGDAAQVQPGDVIAIRFSRGSATAKVTNSAPGGSSKE